MIIYGLLCTSGEGLSSRWYDRVANRQHLPVRDVTIPFTGSMSLQLASAVHMSIPISRPREGRKSVLLVGDIWYSHRKRG